LLLLGVVPHLNTDIEATMAAKMLLTALLLSTVGVADAAGRLEMRTGESASATVNPIRKVVNMLQNMQTKITAEGAKKQKAYDQYMCYCNNADGTLGASISAAQTKIPQVESAIKEGAAMKKQLEAELKDAQVGRVNAKDAIAEATALREKEAAAFAKTKSDADSNIGALSKAIPAIEKGMGGAFLQTSAASVLRQISVSADMIPADRDILASFLSQGSNYAPKSGEIVGILKTMKDEMEKDLADATSEENSAIASFDGLVAAKTKEINALTKAIESKTMRIGELGVKVAQMENDLEDTQEGLAEDQKFLGDLDKNCELKKTEWAEYKKMEGMEMVALADTIKILNDDDALELFKKTLPGSSSSFVQVQVTSGAMRHHAMSVLKSGGHKADPRLDLIELAMRGGKMGFGKIIKMIDNLVVDLKAEQGIDADKKAYCEAEFDKADDKKKGLALDISDLEKAIADAEESIATLKSEISALEDGIKKLDESVAEATSTRKAEHDDYVETLAANTAAKDVLAFAKNRLNKFYNPKMYVAPPKRELAEVQVGAAPPPPPEANLAYKKSGEESGGVIAMVDLLVADIDKENQIMEVEEKDAQKDYEGFMADASEKRATDSKAVTDKTVAKAETETQLQDDNDSKKSKTVEAMENAKYIGGLHQECDWLLKNFDAREAARTGEIDALGKAKAVLSGADYSLVQTASVHLRGSA
jgi:septal ring factor EnvC (AmiA/AmiB activator)